MRFTTPLFVGALASIGMAGAPKTNLSFGYVSPTPPCGSVFQLVEGQTLEFDIKLVDSDPTHVIGWVASDQPPGSSFTPGSPIVVFGNGVDAPTIQTHFEWTPAPGQTGLFSVSWDSANFPDAIRLPCTVTIEVVPQTPCVTATAINGNFNGTAIQAGSTLWFNAVGKATGLPPQGGVLTFRFQTVTITDKQGNDTLVILPASIVTFSPLALAASTTFDVGANEWHTTLPAGYHGNFFLGGGPVPLPQGLAGGAKVSWSTAVAIDTLGVSVQWKWAAAAYTQFTSDNNAIGVKPVDGSGTPNPYLNSDHAGTPENFKPFVTGGGTGGGGSNFTGSYSGTKTTGCP